MFAAFPDYAPEDLESIACTAVREAWHKWNPERGAASTWIYRVAKLQLIDLYRSLERRSHRDLRCALDRPTETRAGPSLRHELDQDDDADWLANVYRMARYRLERYGFTQSVKNTRGRPFVFTRAQVVALLAFKRHRRLTCRDAAAMMKRRPELGAAIELVAVPSRTFFSRIERTTLTVSL